MAYHADIEKCALAVYKQLGYGLSECAYQKALCAELQTLFKTVQPEYRVSQYYTTTLGQKIQISTLRIDLLIDESVVLELKSIPYRLNEKTFNQCRRYMSLSNCSEGYAINFGPEDIQIEKIKMNNILSP